MLPAGPVPDAPPPGSVHLRRRAAVNREKLREALRGATTSGR
jgi:hypothetical protein